MIPLKAQSGSTICLMPLRGHGYSGSDICFFGQPKVMVIKGNAIYLMLPKGHDH